jgi:hypothetical protein
MTAAGRISNFDLSSARSQARISGQPPRLYSPLAYSTSYCATLSVNVVDAVSGTAPPVVALMVTE